MKSIQAEERVIFLLPFGVEGNSTRSDYFFFSAKNYDRISVIITICESIYK